MTAEIIHFPEPEPESKGNGALEVVRAFFHQEREQNPEDIQRADFFLGYLWANGFKVSPVDDDGSDCDLPA